MINKFIFFNTQTGLPSYVAIPTYNGLYENGKVYGENVAIQIDTDDTDSMIIETYHWTGKEIGKHIAKTSPHFVFDTTTFTYKEPDNYLQIIKDQVTEEINNLTSSKIYDKYSLITQINNNARLSELILLDSANTPEADEIRSSVNWINSIRDVGKAAKQAILTSTLVDNIEHIKEDYKLLLETL